jgi:hypothetical protein
MVRGSRSAQISQAWDVSALVAQLGTHRALHTGHTIWPELFGCSRARSSGKLRTPEIWDLQNEALSPRTAPRSDSDLRGPDRQYPAATSREPKVESRSSVPQANSCVRPPKRAISRSKSHQPKQEPSAEARAISRRKKHQPRQGPHDPRQAHDAASRSGPSVSPWIRSTSARTRLLSMRGGVIRFGADQCGR